MCEKRLRKMELLKEELIEPSFYGEDEPDVLLLGWGSLDGPMREAVGLLIKIQVKSMLRWFLGIYGPFL